VYHTFGITLKLHLYMSGNYYNITMFQSAMWLANGFNQRAVKKTLSYYWHTPSWPRTLKR